MHLTKNDTKMTKITANMTNKITILQVAKIFIFFRKALTFFVIFCHFSIFFGVFFDIFHIFEKVAPE